MERKAKGRGVLGIASIIIPEEHVSKLHSVVHCGSTI